MVTFYSRFLPMFGFFIFNRPQLQLFPIAKWPVKPQPQPFKLFTNKVMHWQLICGHKQVTKLTLDTPCLDVSVLSYTCIPVVMLM